MEEIVIGIGPVCDRWNDRRDSNVLLLKCINLKSDLILVLLLNWAHLVGHTSICRQREAHDHRMRK